MNILRRGFFHALPILACLLIASCTDKNLWKLFPRNTFDGPFPKKNKDLTDILGTHLVLKMDKDTIKMKISLKGNLNLITMEKGGDTLFCGTVSKFRGLYYFSQKINDTAYWIFAVKKAGDKIYGLNGMLLEGLKIDKAALSGKYPGMVKYINKDTSQIRLHTDKKIIKEILADYVVDSLTPYTILEMNNIPDTALSVKDSAQIAASFDPDEYNLISKVYPNPITDVVNVDLQENVQVNYMLTDITGKEIGDGIFSKMQNKIDFNDLNSGLYILTVSTADGKSSESVKVIKR